MVSIDIEFLTIGSIILIVLMWFIWFILSRKYHSWRYKPENDRSKKAEEKRRRGEGDRESEARTDGHQRPTESTERDIFPTAVAPSDGETSVGNGKVSRKPKRRLFKRR